jgi:hypothetical protein
MNTRFVVRIQGLPVRFAVGGRYERVARDQDATQFETRDEAVAALQRRQIGFKGVTIIERPAGAKEKANHGDTEAQR